MIRKATDDTVKSALNSATTQREKAAVYAKNGFWFDALTIIGNLYRTNPSDLEAVRDWDSLLKDEDVALDNIVGKFIVECCNPLIPAPLPTESLILDVEGMENRQWGF